MPLHRRAFLMHMAGVCTAAASSAHASPVRQRQPGIRLVVAYPPGGQTDRLTRTLAPKLSLVLGEPVQVENLPGEGGRLAMAQVREAPPDGKTLMVVLGHALPSAAALYPNLPFDPRRDFLAVSELSRTPGMLVAHQSLPVFTLRDLVRHARENLNSVRMGSWAEGSLAHIIQWHLSNQMGAPVKYVPLPGETAILKAVLEGKINLALISPTLLKAHLHSPKIQVLSVVGAKRSPIFPDVPTMQEMGYNQPLFQLEMPISAFVPKGTPPDKLMRLGDAFFTAMHSAEIKTMLDAAGLRLVGSRSAQAQALFDGYYGEIAELVRQTGARPD